MLIPTGRGIVTNRDHLKGLSAVIALVAHLPESMDLLSLWTVALDHPFFVVNGALVHR